MIRKDSFDTKIIGTYFSGSGGVVIKGTEHYETRTSDSIRSIAFGEKSEPSQNERKQTYIYEWVGGVVYLEVVSANLQRASAANEWGLTKYYTTPWCTRFGNGTASGKGKTNNAEKNYISLSSLHIS